MAYKLIAILLCFIAVPAFADTHVAASHSDTDVQAAIDAASDGDTVTIPAGDGGVTWDDQVDLDKAVTLQGPGTGSLTIDCAVADENGGDRTDACLDIDVSTGTQWRVTGLAFTESHATSDSYDGIMPVRGSTDGRIDNCTFTNLNRRVSKVYQTVGTALLFDNNTVTFSESAANNLSGLYIEPSDKETQWDTETSWGDTDDAITIEDCTFIKSVDVTGGAVDGAYGAKIVFRYNTTTNMRVLNHGKEADGSRASMRFEVYNNTIIDDANMDHSGVYPITYRGGSGAAFNNTITGTWKTEPILLKDYSPCDDTCDNATYTYANDCNTAGGYPCQDQVGRMYDSGATQVLAGLAFWGNTKGGSADNSVHVYTWDIDGGCGEGTCPLDGDDIIVENREYYIQDDSFDGSTGMGVGDIGSRPATCTTGVYYWDSGNNVLYKCTDTNTWTSYYQPYSTYPHPLRGTTTSFSDGGGTTTFSGGGSLTIGN
jgi:hypothetical protein